jgi:hypothetical protein
MTLPSPLSSFGLLNAVVFFLYYSKFLGVDDEDMGRWDLVQEGYMTAVGLFMVWNAFSLFLCSASHDAFVFGPR